jgi:ankyrin repeat protein
MGNMMTAATWGDADQVEALLSNGEKADENDSGGFTPLMGACHRASAYDIVKLLLEHGADVNTATPQGFTALMIASENGRLDIVRLLLDANPAVNVQDQFGLTALMRAAKAGHREVVRLLLEKGADPNVKTSKGMTALDYAERSGQERLDALPTELEAKRMTVRGQK